MKYIASVLKGYFVCASYTMNTNGRSHLHMSLMKMYLYIYDNLIGMPKTDHRSQEHIDGI